MYDKTTNRPPRAKVSAIPSTENDVKSVLRIFYFGAYQRYSAIEEWDRAHGVAKLGDRLT
jgi:hypothetical protein